MEDNRHPIAAALDIGSNTLKMLVVRKNGAHLEWVAERSSETRISKGIGQTQPKISNESMERALTVIRQLYREMAQHNPDTLRMVATSAVRDAHNREIFRKRVFQATGHWIEVISGKEEAQLIGRGVLTDPELQDQREIMVFDLGGGSIECIYLKDRNIQWAESIPLGGVRLLEQFVENPSGPLLEKEIKSVREAVQRQVLRLSLQLENPDTALIAGAGGTYVTSRAIIAGRQGQDPAQGSPYLTTDELQSVFQEVASMSLADRLSIPSLPANRADVFPVTLLALLTLGDWTGISNFYHCKHSLRWGVVDQLLAAIDCDR